MLTNILPQNPTARNGQASPKPTARQIEIAAAFDDLITHGEITAAALALGDLWLTLSPDNRGRLAQIAKILTNTDKAQQ